MKRKAEEEGGDGPVKLTKQSDPVLSPVRPGRQKKVPAWMASYVVGGAKAEEAAAAEQAKKGGDAKPTKKIPTPKAPKIKASVKVEKKPAVVKKPKSSIKKTVKTKAPKESPPVLKPENKVKEDVKTVDKIPLDSILDMSFSSVSSTSDTESTHMPSLTCQIPEISNNNDTTNGISAPELDSSVVPNGMSTPVPDLDPEKPSMFEVVLCISTSGNMRDYLLDLQERVRETVWRLQSLTPNLRIGVLAHTQGGIHDDKPDGNRSPVAEHSYIRTGGHSGTKFLDLGATMSQICAFVDSLEPESSVYPDYVQDNLEMALWKLQRCMTWSSCSYRTVIMMGRGRPNRTSFYTQREHWRGWIRSALGLGVKEETPVIDWELEARMLGEMGIHVFTIQALPPKAQEGDTNTTTGEEVKEEGSTREEDEGAAFFTRVPQLTSGQHIPLSEPGLLKDIIVGICCSCQSPELLQDHRDLVRDENDGVLPVDMKGVFVALQLHSSSKSLSVAPPRRLERPKHIREKLTSSKDTKATKKFTSLKTPKGAKGSSKAGVKKAAQKPIAKTLNGIKSVKPKVGSSIKKTEVVKKGRVIKATAKAVIKSKASIRRAILNSAKKGIVISRSPVIKKANSPAKPVRRSAPVKPVKATKALVSSNASSKPTTKSVTPKSKSVKEDKNTELKKKPVVTPQSKRKSGVDKDKNKTVLIKKSAVQQKKPVQRRKPTVVPQKRNNKKVENSQPKTVNLAPKAGKKPVQRREPTVVNKKVENLKQKLMNLATGKKPVQRRKPSVVPQKSNNKTVENPKNKTVNMAAKAGLVSSPVKSGLLKAAKAGLTKAPPRGK